MKWEGPPPIQFLVAREAPEEKWKSQRKKGHVTAPGHQIHVGNEVGQENVIGIIKRAEVVVEIDIFMGTEKVVNQIEALVDIQDPGGQVQKNIIYLRTHENLQLLLQVVLQKILLDLNHYHLMKVPPDILS